MGIKEIFDSQWRKQEYREAILALYSLYDDDANSEQERNQANDLAVYLERRLLRFTRAAEEALSKGNREEARKFLENLPRPTRVDQVAWWESYQPLQHLLERLGEEEPSASFEVKDTPLADTITEPESASEELCDPEQERIRSLVQQLQDPDLKLPDERDMLQELLGLGETADSENQPLGLRLRVAQADYEEHFGDAQKAYDAYVTVQAELQEYRPKGNVAALLRRVNAGLGRVWEQMLPERLAGIREQVAQGALGEARQACQELLSVRADVQVQALLVDIDEGIRKREETRKSAQVRLEQIERALAEGDLGRAERLVEEVGDLPGAQEQIRKVKLARQEFERLVEQAKEKANKLEFLEAVKLYDQVLQLDKADPTIVTARGQANADANKLVKLDSMLLEANQLLEGRERKKLLAQFQDIQRESQSNNWRRQEISQIQIEVEKLNSDFARYQDTFHAAIDSGEIHWPDQVEKWALAAHETDDRPEVIAEYVDEEVGRSLEKHYNFLAGEQNVIDRRGLSELEDSLARLREIQKHWQPFLDVPERLTTHTGSSSLATTSALASNLLDYLPVYEEIAHHLALVEDARASIKAALKSGEGHLSALQKAEGCLVQRPGETNPVYVKIHEYYEELQSEYDQLQKVYEAGHSSALADAEMYLKIGEIDQAWGKLESLQPVDELPTDMRRHWDDLHRDAIACRRLKEAFVQAEQDWHAGRWNEARTNFGRIGNIFRTLRPELQKEDYAPQNWLTRAVGFKEALAERNQKSELINLATSLQELAEQPFNEENLAKFQALKQSPAFTSITNNDNEYLFNLYTNISERETKRRTLLNLLRDNREQKAKEFFAGIPETEPDHAELFMLLKRYNDLGPVLKETDRLLAEAYRRKDIFGILRSLEEASSHLVGVEELARNNNVAAQAEKKKHLIDYLLKTMQSVEEKLQDAQRRKEHEEYIEARRLLADVLGDTPSTFRAFLSAQRTEFNTLTKLAGIQRPYASAIDQAINLIKAGTLDELAEAWQYLGQARDYLKQVSEGLDVQRLQQAEHQWLEALERQIKRVWKAKDYSALEGLLKLAEGQASETLTEYRRLNDRRLTLEELDKQVRLADVKRSEDLFGRLSRLTDTRKPAEVTETALWERRITAVPLMKEAEVLLGQTAITVQQLNEHISRLEAILDDVWPDSHKAVELHKNLLTRLSEMKQQ